jgi:hypothetical protein
MRRQIARLAVHAVSTLAVGWFLWDAGAWAQERTARVVPERPARVFVMAGFDDACRALPPATIAIDQPPTQGRVSLREGQDVVIQSSERGSCIGARVTGTGIYYTARAGATGRDTFAISARLASGELMTRSFTVQIADD